ncbi:transcription initiation factor IIA large subunit isoform X1 [Arachis duranensis]|uniref:Transcription initiation factor IIA large subunit isoform X1 n=1 Tax=Arachis duranensis TaxID=130453 RepID=A0A6P4BUR5_ARADU|nr:transcription initiation factor IIA large subunit isoform X1 [Arachis duranensis]QHO30600.1 Transcription initiation factor IIA large subunit [Arachis hypogaea]
MAATATTSQVYVNVIDDVVTKVRDEFINNGGPGEEVLKELQALWESKMIQAGVVVAPIERSNGAKPTPGGPITPVHDLNVPYEGNEEYETPTAEMLFPPTPLQTPMLTPLPGTVDNSMYNIPTGPSDYTSGNDTGGSADIKGGQSSPYVQQQSPSPWMNQRPSLDVNVAYDEGREEAQRGTSNQPLTQEFFTASMGKRKRDDLSSHYNNADGYIPQQDGAGDSASGVFEIEVCGGRISINAHQTTSREKMSANTERPTSGIPQLDGPIPFDDDMLSTPNIYNYEGVLSEDYNIANTPAPPEVPVSTPALIAQNEVANDNEEEDDDDDEPLNENDDDDDFDDLDQGEDQHTHHLVLAQFDKVTRTKSRWKCTLKDGIMHINNKDILFNKVPLSLRRNK